MIEKKLVQIGNSWGVVVPKAILDGLRINPVLDKVEIYIENNEIRIRKITAGLSEIRMFHLILQ